MATVTIHEAKFNEISAVKEMLLLEDHLKTHFCMDCITKHFYTIIALMEEASGLEGGSRKHMELAKTFEDLLHGINMSNRLVATSQIRNIRKALMGIGDHAHSDNSHTPCRGKSCKIF